MYKKIILLTTVAILSVSAAAFATLPTYTLPETSLEKLNDMPDSSKSLRLLFDSAIKELEKEGFGENNYPNGFGELTPPKGFGKSADELYKSKFGDSWFSSAMDLSAVNANIASKPDSIKITKNADLAPIYNSFKSTLNTGAFESAKGTWASASSKFTMPTADDLSSYKKIDVEKEKELMLNRFNDEKWQEVNNAKIKDVLNGNSLMSQFEKGVAAQLEKMSDILSIDKVKDAIDGSNENRIDTPKFDDAITNGYEGGWKFWEKAEVKNHNKYILTQALENAGIEVKDQNLSLTMLYKTYPEIYEGVKDQFVSSPEEVKAYDKAKKNK